MYIYVIKGPYFVYVNIRLSFGHCQKLTEEVFLIFWFLFLGYFVPIGRAVHAVGIQTRSVGRGGEPRPES